MNKNQIFYGLLVFCALFFFIPLTITQVYWFYMDFTVFVLLYVSFRLSIISISKRIRLLELSLYIYSYVFLVLSPIASITVNVFPWSGLFYSSEVIFFAMVIIVLGMISYDLGIFFNKMKYSKVYQINIKKNKKIFFISVIGVAVTLTVIFLRGGIESLFLPRNELTMFLGNQLSIDSSTRLIQTVLIRVPLFSIFLVALIIYMKDYRENKTLKFNYLFLLIIILGIMTLIINNPISASRYWVGTVYIGTLLIFIKWKRYTQLYLIAFYLILFIIIFPYADVFRNEIDFNLNFNSITYFLSDKGDFDSFQQIMNVILYVDFHGILWGMQFLGVLFFWLPRSIWSEKPIGTGATVSEELGFSFTNVSAPLWSEFYINFGLIGLIFLFFLYGMLSDFLQKKYEYSYRENVINMYSIFVPVYSVYQIFLLRGDLLSSFAYIFPFAIFIYLTLKKNSIRI